MGFLSKLFGKAEPPPAPAPAPKKSGAEKASWSAPGAVPQELAAGEALSQYNGTDRPAFLDVRGEDEVKAYGRIPGSIHVPMHDIQGRMDELDPKKPVIVYCASGMRSFDVGCYLLEKGFDNVSNLNGGMTAWQGPVEKVS